MAYLRRVVLLEPGARTFKADLTARAGEGCWFELHRRGGCGAGELVLNDGFAGRTLVEVGDWVAYEPDEGVRWYLGRVEERRASSPVVARYRLAGMSAQLSEVFPGGFGREIADGVPPHLLARTDDWFVGDPDRSDETFDRISGVRDLAALLMQGYVSPRTDITYEPARIESVDGAVWSVKFRGEETAQTILKELALRARDSSYGVDETGTFFLMTKRTGTALTLREGTDVLSLSGVTDWELLVNRVLLTGDFVYEEESSAAVGRRFARWRGHYIQPASREEFGDRRLKMWVPWIRRREDAVTFLREFFRIYAQPGEKFLIEAPVRGELVRPWEGRVRIEKRGGGELITAVVNTVRVEFDRVPIMRMELGPEDPRELWPEPAQDERYEIPRPEERRPGWGGDLITLTSSEGNLTSSDLSEGSTASHETSSLATSSEELSSSDRSSSSVASSEATTASRMSNEIWSTSGVTSEGATSSSGSDSSTTSYDSSSSALSSTSAASSSSVTSEITTSLDLSSEDRSEFATSDGDSLSSGTSGESSSRSSGSSLSSSDESSSVSGSSETGSSSGASSSDSDSSASSSESSGESSSGSGSSSVGESSQGDSSDGNSTGNPSDGTDGGSDHDGGGGSPGQSSSDDGSSDGSSSSQSSSEESSSGDTSFSGDTSSSVETGSSGSSGSDGTTAEGCEWVYMIVSGAAVWQLVRSTCPNGDCSPPSRAGAFIGERVWTPCQ